MDSGIAYSRARFRRNKCDCTKFKLFEWPKQWQLLISFFRPPNAPNWQQQPCTRITPYARVAYLAALGSIVLTENTSGDDVTSTSFCFANRSACLDFIKSSLSIKASLALHENSTLKNNTANTEIKSQPNVLHAENKFSEIRLESVVISKLL